MMKKIAFFLVLAMFQMQAHAQQVYRLDVKKSKVLWNARKTMGGHYGYLLFNSGVLNYTPGDRPETGSFSFNMNTMHATDDADASGNKAVDKKLRAEGYFSMDKYPEATMTVKQIVPVPNTNNYKVSGDLTIKGISNPIEFTAKITKKGNTVSATAETAIDRLKWQIDMQKPKSWNIFAAITDKVIASEIAVSLNLVFTK